jgi:hypothetical protein
MSRKMYSSVPFTKKATTLPPKVIDLKFRPFTKNRNDGDDIDFDFLRLTFTFDEADASSRSKPDTYLIDIRNLDTGITKSYVQPAAEINYFWQRTLEARASDWTEVPDEGEVNARITVTPLNDLGQGNRSTFLMPMKNMYYMPMYDEPGHNTTMVLAKYWYLFSKTPEEAFNRPKQMHIYLDVSDDDIINDRLLLSGVDYRYNTFGDYQVINSEMFRWVVQDNIFKVLREDGFENATLEEIEFLNLIINSFNDIYRSYVSDNGIGQGNPVVFKIAVKHPRDKNDSIIIYLMKGKSWEM